MEGGKKSTKRTTESVANEEDHKKAKKPNLKNGKKRELFNLSTDSKTFRDALSPKQKKRIPEKTAFFRPVPDDENNLERVEKVEKKKVKKLPISARRMQTKTTSKSKSKLTSKAKPKSPVKKEGASKIESLEERVGILETVVEALQKDHEKLRKELGKEKEKKKEKNNKKKEVESEESSSDESVEY